MSTALPIGKAYKSSEKKEKNQPVYFLMCIAKSQINYSTQDTIQNTAENNVLSLQL